MMLRRLLAHIVAFCPLPSVHPGTIEMPAFDLGSKTMSPLGGTNGLGMVMLFLRTVVESMPLYKKCCMPCPTWLVVPSH